MLTTRRRPSGLAAEAQRLLDLLQALGSTTFRQLLWQRASELDLTFAQSQVLFFVSDHPRCPMGDVAKAFGVTLPAITHIVDRLEEKGFLARGATPGDRRVYALTLTATGRALADELHTIQTRAMRQVLTRMSLGDRARLLKGLEALVGAASLTAEDNGA
jgi:DNA-binding MarR family transcriptional regulator